MQTVCDQKYFGLFTENTNSRQRDVHPVLTMPKHERLLGLQLFVGGLVVSGLMLAAISVLGL